MDPRKKAGLVLVATVSLVAIGYFGYDIFISKKPGAGNTQQITPPPTAPVPPPSPNPPSSGNAPAGPSATEANTGSGSREGDKEGPAAGEEDPKNPGGEQADLLAEQMKLTEEAEAAATAAQLRVAELLSTQQGYMTELEQIKIVLSNQKDAYERELNALKAQSAADKQQEDERAKRLDKKEAELATLASELNPRKEAFVKEQAEARAQLDEKRQQLAEEAAVLDEEATRLKVLANELKQKEEDLIRAQANVQKQVLENENRRNDLIGEGKRLESEHFRIKAWDWQVLTQEIALKKRELAEVARAQANDARGKVLEKEAERLAKLRVEQGLVAKDGKDYDYVVIPKQGVDSEVEIAIDDAINDILGEEEIIAGPSASGLSQEHVGAQGEKSVPTPAKRASKSATKELPKQESASNENLQTNSGAEMKPRTDDKREKVADMPGAEMPKVSMPE